MNFKEYFTKLNEGGQDWEGGHSSGSIPGSFDDSVDATEFMYKISDMMGADALEDWAAQTDKNFGTKTGSKLKAAAAAYKAFLDEMEKAE